MPRAPLPLPTPVLVLLSLVQLIILSAATPPLPVTLLRAIAALDCSSMAAAQAITRFATTLSAQIRQARISAALPQGFFLAEPHQITPSAAVQDWAIPLLLTTLVLVS